MDRKSFTGAGPPHGFISLSFDGHGVGSETGPRIDVGGGVAAASAAELSVKFGPDSCKGVLNVRSPSHNQLIGLSLFLII